jgi:hypothetical protein
MAVLTERAGARNNHHTNTRRDAPVTCKSCGRQVKRRGRRQLYCSTRCRKRGHYARSVQRGDFSPSPKTDIALGTTPLKKRNNFNVLQRAKTLSSHRIFGPPDVLAVEVWGGRSWEPAISGDGIAVEIARLRPRTLVGAS